MRQQLSPEGIWLLTAALILFWLTIAVLVRANARRRGAARRAAPPTAVAAPTTGTMTAQRIVRRSGARGTGRQA